MSKFAAKCRVVVNSVLIFGMAMPYQSPSQSQLSSNKPWLNISIPDVGHVFSNAGQEIKFLADEAHNWLNDKLGISASQLPTPTIEHSNRVAVTSIQFGFTAQPATPSNPMFTWLAYHDSLGGLSVVAPDGSGQQQIRTTGDKPVWAHYGNRMAFIDQDSAGVSQIFTMTALGDSVVQISHTTNGVCGVPTWSPDDRKLAYGIVNGSGTSSTCDIYVGAAKRLNTPHLLLQGVHTFNWLTNNVVAYSQPASGSSDLVGTGQFMPGSDVDATNPGSDSLANQSAQPVSSTVTTACGQVTVTNIRYAHNGDGIAYQVTCSADGTSKYFLKDMSSGGVMQTTPRASVIWLPHGGLLYGKPGHLFYSDTAADVGTSASVPVAALSTISGDLTTAAATAMIIQPSGTDGDHILDPDFISNGLLQKQLTLSNSYDPATGEDTFSAPDVASVNQTTAPYASGTGHVDPTNGQYKPGADTGAVLPNYGLYNKFPITDYADPVSDSYAMTFQGISLPGSGSPLDFRLTYSPQNAWQTHQIFGPGWTHNFAATLLLACNYGSYHTNEVPTYGQIFFQESNGSRQTFQDNNVSGVTPIGTNRFAPQSPGLFASLERVNLQSNGTYVATDSTVEGNNCWPATSGDVVQTHQYIVTLADNTVDTFDWMGRLIKIDHVHFPMLGSDWHPLKFIYSQNYDTASKAFVQTPKPTNYNCPANYYPPVGGYVGSLVRVEDINPGSTTPNNYLDFCYNSSNEITEIHDQRGGTLGPAGTPSLQFQYTNPSSTLGQAIVNAITDWRGKVWNFSYGNLSHDPIISSNPLLNLRTMSPALMGIVSPNQVAIGLEYYINMNNQNCVNNSQAYVFEDLTCLTLYQRISGVQQANGNIWGKVETFTPTSADGTAPRSVLFSTGTGSPLTNQACGGPPTCNQNYTQITTNSGSKVGSVYYIGDPSASTEISTANTFNGGASTPDQYQTTFSYSNQQGTITHIISTGADTLSQYDLSDQYHYDPFKNILHTGRNQNIVLYHYQTLDLNLPSSPSKQHFDYLLNEVDDTVSGYGGHDNCRYSYVYTYDTTFSNAYPTLPTQFDKFDLSNTVQTSGGGLTTQPCNTSSPRYQTADEHYTLTYYKADGYLEAITDPSGVVTFYTYYPNGQLASQTKNYTGALTGNEVDSPTGYPAYSISNPTANVTTSFQYDGDGRMIHVIDRVSGRDDYTRYDDANNVVEQVLNYNAATFPTQTVSQNVGSLSQYDDSGRLIQAINAISLTTNFSYDNSGRLMNVSEVDAGNSNKPTVTSATYTYNAYAGVGTASGHTQVSVTYQRSPSGNPVITSGPAAITDVVCFDVVHRVTAYVENISSSNSNWDCLQTLAAGTSADQNALTKIAYSNSVANGHLPSTITNLTANLKAAFTYDNTGSTKTTTYTDSVTQQSYVWHYNYDQLERLVDVADPLSTDSALHNQWLCYNMDNKVTYQFKNPSVAANIPTCVSDDSGIAAASGAPTGPWTVVPAPPSSPNTTIPTTNQDKNLPTWMMYDGLARNTDSYDELGRRSTTVYDALGRVQSATKNNTGAAFSGTAPDLNNTVSMSYDLINRTQTQTDWLNRATFTQFDPLGRKVKITQNYNQAVTTSQPDQNIVTLYQYDPLGRVIAQSDPALLPAATFGADGSTIVGKQTGIVYDSLGNKKSVTDPTGATTTTIYDALGSPLSVQGPDTPPISYSYDGLQRLTQTLTTTTPVISTATCYTNYSSATERSVISVQNAPQGSFCPATGSGTLQTKALFNIFGEPTQVVQNYQSSNIKAVDTDVATNYAYDSVGDLSWVQMPNDAAATPVIAKSQAFGYDNANRLIQSQQLTAVSTWQTWQTQYDAVGRPVIGITPQGIQTTTTFNLVDNITNVARNQGSQADNIGLTYTYSGGHVTGSSILTKQVQMTDSSSTHPTVYNYDALDRLTAITGGILNLGNTVAPYNNPLSYQYDQDGRRTLLTLPDGRNMGYAYNDNNTLHSATLNSGWTTSGVVSYTYQGLSHLPSTIQYSNNVAETIGYDNDLRLNLLDYKNTSTSTDLMNISYTYDNYGNRNSATELLPEAIPTLTPETDTIGLYRNNTQFYLRNTNSTGNADVTVDYSSQTGGSGGTAYKPVVGDWTGIAADTVGAYNTSTGQFKLCNSNDTTVCSQAANVTQFVFGGQAGDLPLAGHWLSTMLHDGVAIFRASSGLFLFKSTLTAGSADVSEVLGIPGDLPLTGDWSGQGNDTLGVFRPSTAQFYLSNTVTNGNATVNESFQFGNANGGYTAIAGNWTGLASGFGVGLFQNSNGTFLLKNTLAAGSADNTFVFGIPGDSPLAGHWAADTGHAPQAPPTGKAPQILVPPTPNPSNGGSIPGGDQIGDSYVHPVLPAPHSQLEPVMALNNNGLFPVEAGIDAHALLSGTPLLNRKIAYSYDGLNRLTGATYNDNGSANPHYQYSYTYDFNSNRLSSLGQNFYTPTLPTFDATTYTYTTDNQLLTATDQNGTTTSHYFPDGTLGNLSYQAVNSGTSTNTIGYLYDLADRLTTVNNSPTGQNTSYRYDGQDHRVWMTVVSGGQTVNTSYLVDPTGNLPQALAEYPSNAGATYYIPAGMLIGQDQGSSGGTSYFATDGLGSVRSLLNSTGSTSGLSNFDPYGKILPDTGAPGVASHLGYTGALTDANGLVYLNARYYNPGTGNFLSADPMAGKPADPGSFNLYAYVRGNPIKLSDSSGKNPNVAPYIQTLCLLGIFTGGTVCLAAIIANYALDQIQGYSDQARADQQAATQATIAQNALTHAVAVTAAPTGTSAQGTPVNPVPCSIIIKAFCLAGNYTTPLPKLGSKVAETFDNGEYTLEYIPEGTTLYRSPSDPGTEGTGGEVPSYFGPEPSQTASGMNSLYNIAKYGNPMQQVDTWVVGKGGVWAYVGKVAGGSGKQIYLPPGTANGSVAKTASQSLVQDQTPSNTTPNKETPLDDPIVIEG